MTTLTLGDLIPRIVERFDATAGRDAWQPGVQYPTRAQRVANGQRWECITAGTSSSTGTGPAPVMSGTPAAVNHAASANVTDGSVHWKHLSTWSPASTVPTTSIIGEQGEAQNEAPPRLVWVPTRDTFGAPNAVGPSPVGRSVRTRHAGLNCEVYAAPASSASPAANLAAAEQMVNDMLCAVFEELRIGTSADGSTWFGQGVRHDVRGMEWRTKGTLMQNGAGCVVEFVIDLPVRTAAPAHVRPLTFALTQDITAVLT